MQLNFIFFAALLSVSALAAGSKKSSDDNSSKSFKSQDRTHIATIGEECKEILSLEKLIKFASNETELVDKTKNNATKVEEIKTKASAASIKLAPLLKNETLVEDCAIIAAAELLEHECKEILTLERLIALAANATEIADKTNNNATKIEEIKSKASSAASQVCRSCNILMQLSHHFSYIFERDDANLSIQLQVFNSNATLIEDCAIFFAAEKLERECKLLKELEKFTEFASNQTAVADKTKGNATATSEIEAKASEDATLLAILKGNSTLVSACQKLVTTETVNLECMLFLLLWKISDLSVSCYADFGLNQIPRQR